MDFTSKQMYTSLSMSLLSFSWGLDFSVFYILFLTYQICQIHAPVRVQRSLQKLNFLKFWMQLSTSPTLISPPPMLEIGRFDFYTSISYVLLNLLVFFAGCFDDITFIDIHMEDSGSIFWTSLCVRNLPVSVIYHLIYLLIISLQ